MVLNINLEYLSSFVNQQIKKDSIIQTYKYLIDKVCWWYKGIKQLEHK